MQAQGKLTIEGSTGANGQTRRLPVYVRFRDLVEANIVRNWPQLLRLIAIEGFPRGILLSPNARAWEVAEVQAWLRSRPPAGQAGAELPIAMPPADPVGGDLSEKEAGHERCD